MRTVHRAAGLALVAVLVGLATIAHAQGPPPAAPSVAACPACQEARVAADGVEREIQMLRQHLTQVEQQMGAVAASQTFQPLRQRLAALEQQLAALQRACALVCGVPPAAPPSGPGPAPAATAPILPSRPGIRVPLALIASHMNAALAGTTARIHTYQGQGSFVQLGSALGGQRLPFVVGDASFTHPLTGPVRFWVNNLGASNLAVAAAGGALVVRLRLVSHGTDVIVESSSPVVPHGIGVNDGSLTLTLTPALDTHQRPSYGPVSANVSAQYACQGQEFTAALCNLLQGQLGAFINANVAGQIAQALAQTELRERTGAAIWSALTSPAGHQQLEQATGVKIGHIRGFRVDGQGFLLDHD